MDKFDYSSVQPLTASCGLFRRKVGNIKYVFERDVNHFQIGDNLMTVFLRSDLLCNGSSVASVSEQADSLAMVPLKQNPHSSYTSHRFLSGLNLVFDDDILNQLETVAN